MSRIIQLIEISLFQEAKNLILQRGKTIHIEIELFLAHCNNQHREGGISNSIGCMTQARIEGWGF